MTDGNGQDSHHSAVPVVLFTAWSGLNCRYRNAVSNAGFDIANCRPCGVPNVEHIAVPGPSTIPEPVDEGTYSGVNIEPI